MSWPPLGCLFFFLWLAILKCCRTLGRPIATSGATSSSSMPVMSQGWWNSSTYSLKLPFLHGIFGCCSSHVLGLLIPDLVVLASALTMRSPLRQRWGPRVHSKPVWRNANEGHELRAVSPRAAASDVRAAAEPAECWLWCLAISNSRVCERDRENRELGTNFCEALYNLNISHVNCEAI